MYIYTCYFCKCIHVCYLLFSSRKACVCVVLCTFVCDRERKKKRTEERQRETEKGTERESVCVLFVTHACMRAQAARVRRREGRREREGRVDKERKTYHVCQQSFNSQ